MIIGGIFRVWNAMFVSEEKTRRVGHCMDMNGISLSPNGSYADRICDPYWLKEILFISYVEYSDTCANGIALEGHGGNANSVSFSLSGRFAVTSSHDNPLKLWDTKTIARIGGPFIGSSDWVWRVSFSSDGLLSFFIYCGVWLHYNTIEISLEHLLIPTAIVWQVDKYDSAQGSPELETIWMFMSIVSGSQDKHFSLCSAQTQEQIGETFQAH